MYKILCVNCKTHLYNFSGEFSGVFRMSEFFPAKPTIPKPAPGTSLICKTCTKPFYMLRTNGSIIVLTDKGFKPRSPKGDRPPTDIIPIQPQLPDHLDGVGGEFRDPTERR